MTEDEAQAWLESTLNISRETRDRLADFRTMLLAETGKQNLISLESQDQIWARHIVDSAQLLLLRDLSSDTWLDLGTGAGFPGLVIALLRDRPITFVEPRGLRVAFLEAAVHRLKLSHVTIRHCKIESVPNTHFDTISARAFAPLTKTLRLSHSFAHKNTVWLLPKGRSAQTEVESIRGSWHGVFHVKQSVTDPVAGIIVATNVRPVGTK